VSAGRLPAAANGGPVDLTEAFRGREIMVTGATGFLGRRLVERLLEKRQGRVYVLVRGSSLERLGDLIERWSVVAGASAAKRVQPVVGDLRRPLLGVEQEQHDCVRTPGAECGHVDGHCSDAQALKLEQHAEP